MKKLVLCGLACLLIASGSARAEKIPFSPENWDFVESIPNKEVEYKILEHKGRKSLYMRLGHALLKDVEATDGIIEFDLAFEEEVGLKNRSYPGIVWHYRDAGNNEHFYIRPQRSGELKATQYTPVINGSNSDVWYRDYSRPVEFDLNGWNRIKCVISGRYGEVYINDMEKPVMAFPQEFDATSGRLGLLSGGLDSPIVRGAYYANFSFTQVDNPPLASQPESLSAPPGTLMKWAVSEKFVAPTEKYRLSPSDRELDWTELPAGTTGFVNFAKVARGSVPENEQATAFGRVTLISEQAQFKKLRFKYNPHNGVKVYFNGTAIMSIDSNDELDSLVEVKELYLPLRQGGNELWFAVTDGLLGGWGIQAALDDPAGLRITPEASELDFDIQ